MFKTFTKKTGYRHKPVAGRIENIFYFNDLCDILYEEIRANHELQRLHFERLDDGFYPDSHFHILTQDFVYAIAEYFDESQPDDYHNGSVVSIRTVNIEDYANETSPVTLRGKIIDYEEAHRRNKRTEIAEKNGWSSLKNKS